MNLEKFCQDANKSTIFKKRDIKVTEKLLKKYKFDKKESYILNDLVVLSKLIPDAKKDKSLKKSKVNKNKGFPKKEELAIEEIKAILFLDFVYIKKGFKKPGEIALVTVLRFMPIFNQWIDKLRKKYSIDSNRLKANIYNKFPGELLSLVEIMENEASPDYKLLIELAGANKIQSKKSKEETTNGVEKYIDKKFPELDKEIYNFFVIKLGFPSGYITNIRKYILFDKIEWDDDFKSSSQKSAKANVIQNKKQYKKSYKDAYKDFEPHIDIKIYGSTNITDIKDLIGQMYNNGVINKLPSYKAKMGISRIKPKTLLRKVIYFFLIEGKKLNPKEANNVMKRLELGIVPENNSSREVTRFKKLLNL
jgi:hypothetical protein